MVVVYRGANAHQDLPLPTPVQTQHIPICFCAKHKPMQYKLTYLNSSFFQISYANLPIDQLTIFTLRIYRSIIIAHIYNAQLARREVCVSAKWFAFFK